MTDRLSTERIDELAARWTARLDGGALSAADRLALHAWLDEHPAHRAAFEHYQMICDDTAESLPALAEVSAVARPDPAPARRRPGWLPLAAGLAAALALSAVWLVPYFRDTQRVATVAAQRSTLSLPDGSRTELNAQTALFTDFRRGRRFVRLEKGEAFFSVAKDAAHPFSVETPGGTVRVTGTQFNVRLAPDGHPEVTLLEGAVEIQNSLALLRLKPGEQLSAAGELRPLSTAEMERTVAWREGRIVLNGLTLADATARFAAFHGKTIEVSADLAALQLGGVSALDDLQGFFDALAADPLALRVVRRTPDNFVITRR
jgi:transmembrane sensor